MTLTSGAAAGGGPVLGVIKFSGPPRGLQVAACHLAGQTLERALRLPAQPPARLTGVADQEVDFGRAVEPLVDFNIALVVEARLGEGARPGRRQVSFTTRPR